MTEKKYLFRFVREINHFDGTIESKEELKNLICHVSNNKSTSKDPVYRELIVDASMKLRMFGYYTSPNTNKIQIEDLNILDSDAVSYFAIEKIHHSEMSSEIILDGTQKEIIDSFQKLEKRRLFLSAPTSYGKTFLLREILYLNKEKYKQIFLIFPTVALLFENTEKIQSFVKANNLEYKIINNVYTKFSYNEKNIFILTPERALQILALFEGIIDFFFFDEIYKIDEDFSIDEDSFMVKDNTKLKDNNKRSQQDGTQKQEHNLLKSNRAEAFRICLYLLSKRVNEYYLAGPYIALEKTSPGLERFIKTNEIETKKIELEPTMKVVVEAWDKKSKEKNPISGERNVKIYERYPNNTKQKAIGIIKYIKEQNLGKTILYCSFPKKTMEYTKGVIDALGVRDSKQRTMDAFAGEANLKSGPSLLCTEFAEHLKHRYCNIYSDGNKQLESWSMVSALSSEYGIHHGRLPKYIQKYMLNLFNDGAIKFLFCTSTIIEGVNTDANNIVILGNSAGDKELTTFSIRNIKGRAGRYYNQYIGYIFFTDKKQKLIDGGSDTELDFKTFSERKLSDVDLDSAYIEDLRGGNITLKHDRDLKLDKKLLPDEVFIQNRLTDRVTQEKILAHLSSDDGFEKFEGLTKNSSTWFFLVGKYLDTIIDELIKIKVLGANEGERNKAIIQNYSIKKFAGLMEYQLVHEKKEIEDAFLEAFYQIRTVIEFEMPKLLRLFETLYRRAGEIKKVDMTSFSMSEIIRFYETGVESEVGNYLIEFGYPTESVQELERTIPELKKMNVDKGMNNLSRRVNSIEFLDNFEKRLLKRAINSYLGTEDRD